VRLILRGQRREVTIQLIMPTIAAALDTARQQRSGTVKKRDRLRVRIHENGRVWCRTIPVGKSTPPYFRGHLGESGDGAVLRGVIRESRSSGFVTAIFTILTLFMAAVAVICALSHPVVVPGLVICSIAAFVFGPMSFALRGQRVSRFKYEADDLDGKIRWLFGAAPRHSVGDRSDVGQ
jgi:hypothetical protein